MNNQSDNISDDISIIQNISYIVIYKHLTHIHFSEISLQ